MRRVTLRTTVLLGVLIPALLTAGLEAQRRGRRRPAAPRRPAAISTPAPPSQPALDAPLPGARSPRNANYQIEVALDPAARTLTGHEILSWRNITRDPVSDLRFHLYYNAWKNTDSTWMRESRLRGRGNLPPSADDWAWIEVTSIRLVNPGTDLTAQKRYISPDDGNPDDQTVLAVPLPAPVGPGEIIDVEIAWTSKIPRTFARTGTVGQYFFLAQWFPKIGVLEDAGWNCHQFHAGTEFFSDYGSYDVQLSVPKGWVIGATGRERPEARRDAGGVTTWRYTEDDVHDFAWTTSPAYVETRARFAEPGLPPVEMRLLLQPEHEYLADRHFAATRVALKYYGQWFGPYPYGHITIVDPAWQSGAGGMDYPTLFTAGSRWIAPAGVASPEGVTIHECGHQFWYGIVGNNEFEHAWEDEGLNTFSTARAEFAAGQTDHLSRRYFGGFVPFVFRDIPLTRVDHDGLGGYRQAAERDVPATPSYLYWPSSGGALSYNKTALWLHTLERYLGWTTLQKVMSTFFERWQFRHPKPEDFFTIVNEVSGRDMTWFFDQVFRSSNVFDYGVEELTSTRTGGVGFFDVGGRPVFSERGGTPAKVTVALADVSSTFKTTVVVRRYGEAVFPVDVVVRLPERRDDPRAVGRPRPLETFTYTRPAQAVSAVVDPDRVLLLDVNSTNNSRTLDPQAGRASTKWMLRWMTWMEDLLLTYACFV